MSLKRGLIAALLCSAAAGTPALAEESAAPKMRYIPPVTNPTFAESPFITTELRPIFIRHDIPSTFATNGDYANVIALQARYALTDRLALIATKDGYADVNYGAFSDDSGFLNIAAGAKYAVIDDPEAGQILTLGARYEFPTGDVNAGPFQIQGKGSGFANVFVSGAQQWGNFQVQASANAHIAIDSDVDSSMLVGSMQANYAVLENFLLGGFYPLVEVNVFHHFNDPGRTPLTAAGFDVFSLGQRDSNTIVTGAAGFRMHITESIQFGTAVELPLTDDNGELTNWRLTADAVIRF
jgi:hypothetical protein